MTDLKGKSQLLHERLGSLESLLVAYSGGTDSAYLAFAAHRGAGGTHAGGDRRFAVVAA